jgi:hypothetical protein
LSRRAGKRITVESRWPGVSDPLNDILVECCKLRGCYPLMHRTLHEFNWFCNCAIGGAGPFIDGEIATAEADGDEALAGALRTVVTRRTRYRTDSENGIPTVLMS